MSETQQRNWSKAISRVVLESSFFAPYMGVQYFAAESELWPVFLATCIPAALLSMGVFLLLAVTIFPIYAFVTTMVTGPFGLISAIITLFSLSRQLTVWLSNIVFIRQVQASIFDTVLKKEGAGDIVIRHEFMHSRYTPKKPMQHRLYYQFLPFISREVFYILLGIIPLVGPFIVIFIQAPIKGYKTHKHYYHLMMWNYVQINRFNKEYQSDYTAFGIGALLLEMVPGLTVFFMFTNNIGMALWTARYYKDFEDFMRDTSDKPSEKAKEMELWLNALKDDKSTHRADVTQ
ncbi:hypothetical protein OXX79_005188 [Metschnikowia pulcherrima]